MSQTVAVLKGTKIYATCRIVFSRDSYRGTWKGCVSYRTARHQLARIFTRPSRTIRGPRIDPLISATFRNFFQNNQSRIVILQNEKANTPLSQRDSVNRPTILRDPQHVELGDCKPQVGRTNPKFRCGIRPSGCRWSCLIISPCGRWPRRRARRRFCWSGRYSFFPSF